MTTSQHRYEVRPRKDKRGVDLISDALPFGRLWYGEPNAVANAIGYAQHRSRSHDAVIRVYDEAGNVTATHEHKGDFKEWRVPAHLRLSEPWLSLNRVKSYFGARSDNQCVLSVAGEWQGRSRSGCS